MDLATPRLLATYNESANRRMNVLLEPLGAEEWEREFFGYFKTLKGLCNHLYISDFVWLRRFSGFRDFSYTKNALLAADIAFGMTVIADPKDYIAKRESLDGLLAEFAKEITERDFAATLSYKDSGGNPHRKNFGSLVLHMFNHETHHRGMISLYLEGLGIENDFNSLSDLIAEQ